MTYFINDKEITEKQFYGNLAVEYFGEYGENDGAVYFANAETWMENAVSLAKTAGGFKIDDGAFLYIRG